MRIEYHSQSDKDGKCSFSLHWASIRHSDDVIAGVKAGDKFKAAQHFYADPTERGYRRPEDV